MILVDAAIGSKELRSPILARNVSCDIASLKWGDACFEGNGPEGPITVGIERKRLHDILACIDDGRYNAQRMGMAKMYNVSFLLIEGLWRPNEQGILMEGFRDHNTERALMSTGKAREVVSWTQCKPGGKPVMYNKLYRYLISVNLSGVNITFTRDLEHTAFNICEMFHYFQKKWSDHRSLLERRKLQIASMNAEPPLVRRWAEELDGVGQVHGIAAQHYFSLRGASSAALKLANSDESDWVKVGVNVKVAQGIVKQIRGW